MFLAVAKLKPSRSRFAQVAWLVLGAFVSMGICLSGWENVKGQESRVVFCNFHQRPTSMVLLLALTYVNSLFFGSSSLLPANRHKAHKIVSLGLFKVQGNAHCARNGSCEQHHAVSNLIESYLWIPQAPANREITISPLEPLQEARPFDPLINIDFGGAHGVLLSSLTRVVVHMVSEDCPVVGFEFFYLDQTLKFGYGGGTEISALIDGPAGERIIDLEVITNDPLIDGPERERILDLEVILNGPKFGMRGLQVWI